MSKNYKLDLPRTNDLYIEILNELTLEKGETYKVWDVSYSVRDNVVFIELKNKSGTLLSMPLNEFIKEVLERKWIRG